MSPVSTGECHGLYTMLMTYELIVFYFLHASGFEVFCLFHNFGSFQDPTHLGRFARLHLWHPLLNSRTSIIWILSIWFFLSLFPFSDDPSKLSKTQASAFIASRISLLLSTWALSGRCAIVHQTNLITCSIQITIILNWGKKLKILNLPWLHASITPQVTIYSHLKSGGDSVPILHVVSIGITAIAISTTISLIAR